MSREGFLEKYEFCVWESGEKGWDRCLSLKEAHGKEVSQV